MTLIGLKVALQQSSMVYFKVLVFYMRCSQIITNLLSKEQILYKFEICENADNFTQYLLRYFKFSKIVKIQYLLLSTPFSLFQSFIKFALFFSSV